VDVELARQQWEQGYRRLEEARADRRRYGRLVRQMDAVTAELRMRVGQTFTLEQLAGAYGDADRWTLDVVEGVDPDPGATNEVSIVADAGFHLYARGATDYSP
jgi:hypothetical protein